MQKKFAGFNTMAVALAAAGLTGGIGVLPAVAAAMVAMGKRKLVLIEGRWEDRHWVEEVCEGRYNDYRGRNEWVDSDVRVLEVRWLDSFSDLTMEDRKKQDAWVEGGKAGWLSPQGEFYSCNYEGHEKLARYVLQMGYSELEAAGWVHVDCEGVKGQYTYRTATSYRCEDAPLTEAQEKWLIANGHDTDPRGNKKRKQMPEMIQLGHYKIDAEADRAAFERQMHKAGISIEGMGRKPTSIRDFR